MKRKKDNKLSMVYAYGAVVNPDDNEYVMAEVEKQRAMWDSLVIADRDIEAETEKMMVETMPEYADASSIADIAHEAAREVVRMRNVERSKTGKKATSFDEAVKEAYAFFRKCTKAKWDIAKKWRKENPDHVRFFRSERYEKFKNIRKNSGLFWSNYNRVMDSYDAAKKNCMKTGRKVRLSDWSREDGVLTVQIQRTKSGLGASPAELMDGTMSMFQIGYVPKGVENLTRNKRKKGCRTMMEMRIDAAGHMLRIPIFFHRPLPQECRVKNVQLSWRKNGERIRGQLCLNISMGKQIKSNESKKACGIDLGWRKNNNALLVATAHDTSGNIERLELDSRFLGGMDQVDRLKGYVDDIVLEIFEKTSKNIEKLPDTISDILKRYNEEKGHKNLNNISMKKIADVIRFYLVGGMASELPLYLIDLYKRYRHLKDWMDNLRRKLILRRRETYRIFAKKIAETYSRIGIEDMDLSEMARVKSRITGDNELHIDARRQRVIACVHSLRAEIEHQAVKRGSEIVYATKYTTMRCVSCGEITSQADRAIKIWTCEKCGSSWDQDINAAKNLMAVATGEIEEYHPIQPRKKAAKNINNSLKLHE